MKTTNLFDYNSFGIIKTNDSAYAILIKFGSEKYMFRVLNSAQGNPITLCTPVGFDEELLDWLKPEIDKLIKKLGYRKLGTKVIEKDFDPTTVKVLSIEPMPKNIKHLSDASIKEMCSEWGFDVPEEVTTDPFVYSGPIRDYTAIRNTPEGLEKFELIKTRCTGKSLPESLQITAEKFRRCPVGEVPPRALAFTGPAGTGKSTMAELFALYLGAPLIRINGESGTTRDDLLGMYTENPNYDGVSELNRFQFSPGPIYEAASKGYVVLVDEFNFIPDEVRAIFNPLLDKTPTYSFMGIEFPIHPNFILIATLNPGYKGTSELNDSLKTRFINIAVDKLKKKDFIAWMKTSGYYRPEYSDKFFELLYDYQRFVQDFADSLMESASVCVRHAFNFLESLTIKALSFEEFVDEFVTAYVTATAHWDGDTSASIQAFRDTQEFKDKMSTLYSLYPYQVVEDVEEVFCDFNAWKTDKESGFVSSEPSEPTNSGDVSLEDVFDGFDTLQM